MIKLFFIDFCFRGNFEKMFSGNFEKMFPLVKRGRGITGRDSFAGVAVIISRVDENSIYCTSIYNQSGRNVPDTHRSSMLVVSTVLSNQYIVRTLN